MNMKINCWDPNTALPTLALIHNPFSVWSRHLSLWSAGSSLGCGKFDFGADLKVGKITSSPVRILTFSVNSRGLLPYCARERH